MAFGFFRRRQKMVIIIMVVLMVSFLVGYQGFEMIVHPNRDPVIGQMGDEKITHGMLVAADSDVHTMERLVQRSMRLQEAFSPLMRDNRGDRDAALAFALLLAEAKKAKVRVSESEVDASIDQLAGEWIPKRLPDGTADLESFYAALRDMQVSKPSVRSALASWEMIYKNFEANQLGVPPSQPELRRLYRDTQEKVAVRVAMLKASDFLDKVSEPNDADLQSLFGQFQNSNEGDVTEIHLASGQTVENPFGFGYMQPNRASVQYLLLRNSVVERGSQPGDQAVKQYFLDNQAKYDRKHQQLSDVKDEIAKSLRERVVKSHADSVLSQADSMITASLAKSDSGKANVYEEAKSEMMLGADDVLAAPLKDVHLDGTVEQVVSQLARQAELDAIVYPYDVPGAVNIGSGLHVTLDEAQTTLGEALQKITDKVMGPQGPASGASSKAAVAPKIVWKKCKGFDGVIFPVGPGNLDLFPLRAGETGLKSPKELREDAVVGYASAGAGGAGVSLLQVVFTSPAFKANNPNPSSVNVGSAGQQMVSNTVDKTGEFGGGLQAQGPLLWRLADAKVAYTPEAKNLQTNQELRAKVAKDWKDRAAYGLALEEAKKIVDAAKKKSLEVALKESEVARKLKLKTQETKPFSRQLLSLPQRVAARRVAQEVEWNLSLESYRSGKQFTREEIEMVKAREISVKMPQLLSLPPLDVSLGNPGEEVNLNDRASVQQFIDADFTLAPANPEPPYKDKAPVALAELKLVREVAVMERSDYVPIVRGDFEGISQNPSALSAASLAMFMVEQQKWITQRLWFYMAPESATAANAQGIVARTGYKKVSQ